MNDQPHFVVFSDETCIDFVIPNRHLLIQSKHVWLYSISLIDIPFYLSSVVQVNSPYLEEHLMHMIKQDQSKVHNMDLLWRYYEKNRNFGKAAHVLARLADMHRFGHTKTR